MKKILFLAGVIGTLCFGGCSNEEEVVFPEHNELSLVAPNGEKIAADMDELNQKTADIIAKQFGDDFPFCIQDIKYAEMTNGFLAIIDYKLENGVTANYAYSNNMEVLNSTSVDRLTIEGDMDCDILPTSVKFKCSSATNCSPCQVRTKTYTVKTEDGESTPVTEVSCSTACSDCKLGATIF